ncbi:MAG: VCBS repeat-containing protein [Xanthomonadales bacterium]|nr:VCBS repeat-containing protein [Xanthomonadales bacterium]MBK7145748.1 VCBS repeat-containing protein [Xanthomonadales bacterium]MCC6561688.1 VCBS repeat-containing protein [Xanthomonadales bacterium]
MRLPLAAIMLCWMFSWMLCGTVASAPLAFANGGFETDADSNGQPDQWTWPTTHWTWDGSIHYAGARSARVERVSGGESAHLISAARPIVAQHDYALSYWLRTASATARPIVVVYQYDAGGNQVGNKQLVAMQVTGDNDWQAVTLRFQSHAGASTLRLRVYLAATTTGTFWFDDIDLTDLGPSRYPLAAGFPTTTVEWVGPLSPAVADLDRDGHNEVLAITNTGRLLAWNAAGVARPGFPIDMGGNVAGHIALTDLNHDQDLEILVGVGSSVPDAVGHVHAWQPDGSALPGWPQTVARHPDGRVSRVSSVLIARLEAGLDPQVIATTNNNDLDDASSSLYTPNLYAWRSNGQTVPGLWPVDDVRNAAILGAAAVADLDGDGYDEIATGRDYHYLFAYDRSGGNWPGWPQRILLPVGGNENVDPRIVFRYAQPVFADLDGDGRFEYAVAGMRRPPDVETINNIDVLVYRPDGQRHPSWTVPAAGTGVIDTTQWMSQAAAVADLDGDGRPDLVVPMQDGHIRAYRHDRSLIFDVDYAGGLFLYASEPVIGDIDADGHPEIVFGTHSPLQMADGVAGVWVLEHDGSAKPGTPLRTGMPGVAAPAQIVDVDGDGGLDLVAVSAIGNVFVWQTGAPTAGADLPWPTARHDLARSGRYNPPLFADGFESP